MRPIQIPHLVRLASWLAVWTFWSGAAVAQTFVVDDDAGPGVDFPSIVDALAVVPDGSTLDIRAGSYVGFTLDRPVSMLGESAGLVIVAGQITIDGANVDDIIKLAGISSQTFYFQDVSHTLLLEDVKGSPFGEISCVRCDDLRFQNLDCESPVSLLDCKASIFHSIIFPYQTLGETALTLEGSTSVQIHDSLIVGGQGLECGPVPGCLSSGGYGEDGGPGILINPGTLARIVRSQLMGGVGGPALCGCLLGGLDGKGALVLGRLESWMSDYTFGSIEVMGSGSVDLNEPIPTLSASTTGFQIDLIVSSLPGSSGRIIFGRGPVGTPTPGDPFGLLVRADRIGSLGESPASGSQALTFSHPGWPIGTTLWLQVSQTLANGSTRLSNPIAVVVRQ